MYLIMYLAMYLVCPGRIAWTFTPNRVPDFVSRICILDKYQVKRWVANKSVVGCTLCPQFRSIASFALRCIFSTVSLYTINWNDITSQCASPFEEFLGARIPFLLFFLADNSVYSFLLHDEKISAASTSKYMHCVFTIGSFMATS